MKTPVAAKTGKHWPGALILMAAILAVLFWRSFLPGYVHFSNDLPLGQQNAAWFQPPGSLTGMWADQGGIGSNAGSATLDLTILLFWLLGPIPFAKFFPALALFTVGLGAWTFFRTLKLSPFAALLGALAAMLNSTFFACACWGVAPQQFALAMDFFALALIVANTPETPWLTRWLRLALAGLCVGINVMEAADIGALYSLFIAAFVFFKALVETNGNSLVKIMRGISRVVVVAVFAGFIAIQTVTALIGSQIQGIAGTAQDTETKAQHWDWATQWSLPKTETLNLIVPGLFGYKLDTPKDMMPMLQEMYQGGEYWGGVGRDPVLDRYFDSGSQGAPPPSNFMRFTGGGNYCGILVILIAFWAIAQSFRRKQSCFSDEQKYFIWFWTAVLAVSLPLAWGRFAPMFYGALYQLPYFSTIRNPTKFLTFFSWALVILFACGVNALNRLLNATAPKSAGWSAQLKNWWARASQFDRRWTWACLGVFGASILGWLIFAAQKPDFIQYLHKVGFPDTPNNKPAEEIAAFCFGQIGWFLALFAVAILLLTLVLAGYFAGARAKTGAVLLGAFLLFDLGRADLPYVIHWDYKQKYEIGTLNPIVDFLRQKPYEHRVAGLPFRVPPGMELFDQLYRIEWMQHLFPYHNIQTLDIWQMPRIPADWKAYLEALSPDDKPESVQLIARKWQLTNTRYLLGPAGYLEVMNDQLDPAQKRFRILQRFEVVPKPGITQPTKLEELTAVSSDNGRYALFEFTGALPRAKLYADWQVNTNDATVLKTLADLNFDPAKTVFVDTPQKDLPNAATNENTGIVEFKSYAPNHIVFAANAPTPSVLLLNDKYDFNWHVTVDGKPAELLRCNFIMRGVYLPSGAHTVAFDFSLPRKPFYITLTAIGVGLFLSGCLLIATRRIKR
jgi:hypothetical protein